MWCDLHGHCTSVIIFTRQNYMVLAQLIYFSKIVIHVSFVFILLDFLFLYPNLFADCLASYQAEC